MIRKAFKMKVHPGREAEYTDRHNPIWSDLADVLHLHGARNYSIFLDEETATLFAYVEIESETRWAAVAQTEVCRRWWTYMQELMETNPDGSPKSVDLREVFHLE
ncbi:L-rhamnose mutarotase [Lewinella marina]|uniref:L-rhamnose mutarotase n=1 Tax=Neolewinella marina TaxID=438751 RepID=A0A2G0CCP4_9BACT|nr:L-rhamnose mutarotase [Neolewinella marina]NJB87573.1 L-rhamnose mutarotase [Neolewinella marina]PHK97735.1 L-rhamnose mutarotase [Neolewinella marina]